MLFEYIIVHSWICVVFMFAGKNAIHSVFALLSTFLYGAAAFLYFQQEFLGLIFVIVYAGAIAILFLFVVMMLNLKETERNPNDNATFIYLIWFGVGYIYNLMQGEKVQIETEVYLIEWSSKIDNFSDLHSLGQILYDFLGFSFILAGFLLLVAMVGAIGLTLKSQERPQTFNLSRGNSLAPIIPEKRLFLLFI